MPQNQAMVGEKIIIQVFHGTSYSKFDSLKKNNFLKSTGIEHERYLGDGAYFFCDGVPPKPSISAEKWAIAEAWDNDNFRYKYLEYCVVEAKVELDQSKFLDLTSWDGIEIFNYFRDKYVGKLRKAGRQLSRGELKDGHVINEAIKSSAIEVEAVKGNYFFKFKDERIVKAQFTTPNCTIIAVRNTDCILKESIKIFLKNRISK
ncbi:MAG: hypothetical protein IT258_10840 [Saprospiraceae bacterium]|nr:hypothetical protein [Saprospiraceae bacterium]